MKRLVMAVALVVSFALGGVLVKAATTPGTPEVDNSNATISVKAAHRFVPTQCVGEDLVSYVTYRGKWTGTQTDASPGSSDYSLNGQITVGGIVWTINLSTKRGVLTGNINLADAAGLPIYSGKLTVITQGLPGGTGAVQGRGWISAAFAPADDAVPPPGDDMLLANTEWLVAGNFSASAAFGDVAPSAGTPNYSVVTNVAPKALDGVC
jgi:hypothetical protein